jgi:T4 RnlA family RNA ligase
MKTNLETLYTDLMALCGKFESFYFVDQKGPDGYDYRTFTYRLASFTEFQEPNAVECRGHTFKLIDDGSYRLASLPMAKFFNYGEHVGWGTEMDLNEMDIVLDKLDGSLISTVISNVGTGDWFLKSKTSFKSQQVIEATELVNSAKYENFRKELKILSWLGYTVNMEYMSPTNQIVIGYSEPMLKVLNVRDMTDGSYKSHEEVVRRFGQEFVVQSHEVPVDGAKFLADAERMTGIEGFVIRLKSGLLFKHKTEAYCILHHLKDSVNNAKKLWAACLNETGDDLRALFKDDPITLEKIAAMEVKASAIYNGVHKSVHDFYNENKDLIRKDYAIKGTAELAKSGTFSLAMNLYLGKEANVKEFLIKNYKSYGISDVEEESNDE